MATVCTDIIFPSCSTVELIENGGDLTTSEYCGWVDGGGNPGGRISIACGPEVPTVVARDG